MKKRKDKVSTVENIISEEVPIIEATMKRLDAEPLVKDVFTNADSLRIKELQKALQMLGETDEERIRIIDDFATAVVESIVSTTMNNLRKASEQGNPDLLDIASKLFVYKKKELQNSNLRLYCMLFDFCHDYIPLKKIETAKSI